MNYRDDELSFDVTQRLDTRGPGAIDLDLQKRVYTQQAARKRKQRIAENLQRYGDSEIDRGADNLTRRPTSTRRYDERVTEQITSVVPYRNLTTHTPARRLDLDPQESYIRRQEPVPLYCDGWHVTFQGMFFYTLIVIMSSGIGSILLFIHFVTR